MFTFYIQKIKGNLEYFLHKPVIEKQEASSNVHKCEIISNLNDVNKVKTRMHVKIIMMMIITIMVKNKSIFHSVNFHSSKSKTYS